VQSYNNTEKNFSLPARLKARMNLNLQVRMMGKKLAEMTLEEL